MPDNQSPLTPSDVTKMQVEAVKSVAKSAINTAMNELHSTIVQVGVLFPASDIKAATAKISEAVSSITGPAN
jgi:hypothetical protein